MESVLNKLDDYIHTNRIPNIFFHGPQLTRICPMVTDFVNRIYQNDKENIQKYVITVNCVYFKGIKFIRDELKFFSKTYTTNPNIMFKSVVLMNADHLTIDAQSALRRCIEIFSNTTRFFICGESKYKLLKPILSRFCNIYVPSYPIEPIMIYSGIETKNLDTKGKYIKKIITNMLSTNTKNMVDLIKIAEKIYAKAYCSNDIIHLLQYDGMFNMLTKPRYELMFVFNKIKTEFRNEEMLLFFMIYMISSGLNYTYLCNKI